MQHEHEPAVRSWNKAGLALAGLYLLVFLLAAGRALAYFFSGNPDDSQFALLGPAIVASPFSLVAFMALMPLATWLPDFVVFVLAASSIPIGAALNAILLYRLARRLTRRGQAQPADPEGTARDVT